MSSGGSSGGKVGDTDWGYKKDGSGKWWSNSKTGDRGQDATRSSGSKVTHYRHSGGKVEGWTHDKATGSSEKFSKSEK